MSFVWTGLCSQRKVRGDHCRETRGQTGRYRGRGNNGTVNRSHSGNPMVDGLSGLRVGYSDPQYDNLEEKRVITGPERNAARTLGEGQRCNHQIRRHFYVPNPILH